MGTVGLVVNVAFVLVVGLLVDVGMDDCVYNNVRYLFVLWRMVSFHQVVIDDGIVVVVVVVLGHWCNCRRTADVAVYRCGE